MVSDGIVAKCLTHTKAAESQARNLFLCIQIVTGTSFFRSHTSVLLFDLASKRNATRMRC
jgi:hypothetical protein